MNQYLLLRDNKQTGPYSAEELAAKGLKAYDLVWLEGRSAAWRYPCELEELKPFAPVVEEQPYDRFYKKPEQSHTQLSASAQAVAATQKEAVQPQAVSTTGTVKSIQEEQPVAQSSAVAEATEHSTAKHIYVTMPVKPATTATATPVTVKEEKAQQAIPAEQTNKPDHSSANTYKAPEKKAAASSYIISKEDDELNSDTLAQYNLQKDINNNYLSDYESRKAQFKSNKTGAPVSKKAEAVVLDKPLEKPAKTERFARSQKDYSNNIKAILIGSQRYLQDNKNVTRSLLAACLILGGIVIGLIINSGHKEPDKQILESLVKEIREQKEKSDGTTASSETENRGSEQSNNGITNNDNPPNTVTEPQPPASNNIGAGPEQNNRHAIIKKDNTLPATQNKSVAVPVSNTTQEPVEAQPAVLETKEKNPNDEQIEKARKNIYDLVAIEASQYKVGLLGGVSELDITVSNNSLYALDRVSVEVKYYGPEKKLVKTQTLVFNNVPPGRQRTLEAPRTNRGITIDYAVTGINSKALGLAQAAN